MDPAPRIATIMTCHNRRETTLACLGALASQRHFREEDLFLVDDGSTDGTGDAVRSTYPSAHVITGDGTLFWSRGMNCAWAAALDAETRYDWYFWLNDDVLLDPGALDRLLADARMCADPHEPLIIAGATLDSQRERVTYGAHWQGNPRRPLRLELMVPGRVPQMATTVSGNAVLVSAPAQEALGLFDPAFEHIYSELDYSLRAQAEGIPVMLAGEPVGVCEANDKLPRSSAASLPLASRLRARLQEDRRIHARDWRRMVARHDGSPFGWLRHLVGPYLRLLSGRPSRHAEAREI